MNENELNFIGIVNKNIYLNAKFRYDLPANKFPNNIIKETKNLFFNFWKAEILKRTDKIELGDKEKELLKYCYEWAICSPDFKGDLRKGLYIASKQGFGKDAMVRTIIEFYNYFIFSIRHYTYVDFCSQWFELSSERFNSPIYISDIYPNGKMKREKESIPFLEFLDHRDQLGNTRGLLITSNYTPKALQEELEKDKLVKRLYERVKECFNVVIIEGAESKRIEQIKII
jgi:hypothetical protein